MARKPSDPTIGFADCQCLAIRQASRQVTRLYDQSLAASGLRSTQLGILSRLHGSGPSSINALAEALALDRTTLGRNILPLQRQGLVAAMRRKDDRRSKEVHVTRAGVAKIAAAARLWTEAQTRFEAAFGTPRVSALRALLSELSRAKLKS